MRKFLFIIFIVLSGKMNAQDGVGAVVTGKVVEKSTREFLEFINVALFLRDSVLVKGLTTNKDGIYLFSEVSPGSYYVQTSYIG